ncbi:MAG: T9SS type A sorting domain-containing protein [Chitinophagaceae bacterium]
MKNFKLLSILIAFVAFTSQQVFAQSKKINAIMKNISLVAPNEIQFDLYLENASTDGTTLSLNGFQIGIDFDFEALSNGGTLSTNVVKYNPLLPTSFLQDNRQPNWGAKIRNFTPTTGHWRVSANTISKADAPVITKEGLWYGTYSITNSTSFNKDAIYNFEWFVGAKQGRTKTAVAAFEGTSTLGKPFTSPATDGRELTLKVEKKAGPASIDEQVNNGGFSLYPSPAYNKITLNINADKNESTTFDIIDMQGKLVKSFPLTVKQDSKEYSFDISALAAGAYTAQVPLNGKTLSVVFNKK